MLIFIFCIATIRVDSSTGHSEICITVHFSYVNSFGKKIPLKLLCTTYLLLLPPLVRKVSVENKEDDKCILRLIPRKRDRKWKRRFDKGHFSPNVPEILSEIVDERRNFRIASRCCTRSYVMVKLQRTKNASAVLKTLAQEIWYIYSNNKKLWLESINSWDPPPPFLYTRIELYNV